MYKRECYPNGYTITPKDQYVCGVQVRNFLEVREYAIFFFLK